MTNQTRYFISLLLLSCSLLLLASCVNTRRGGDDDDAADDDDDAANDDDDGVGQIATGDGPCDDGGDCEGGVCVALIEEPNPPVYCTQPCGSGCPDDMYCDDQTFALAGVDFCRFGGNGGNPPPSDEQVPPEEAPSLPCSTDSDCEGNLICAEFMGESGCAPPCNNDDDCVVSMMGMSFLLAECGQEDGGRDVCLPREECYDGSMASFMSCIDMPF